MKASRNLTPLGNSGSADPPAMATPSPPEGVCPAAVPSDDPAAGTAAGFSSSSWNPAAPSSLAAAQRILDAEAQRLLAEQMDRDPIGPATTGNVNVLDGRPDQTPPGLDGEPVPVLDAHGERGSRAA